MKVYVVLKGKYSDRHIVGVAIDEEHRDAIMNACTSSDKYSDDPYVEEYDTEYWSPLLKNGSLYRVKFADDGSVETVAKYDGSDRDFEYCENRNVRFGDFYLDDPEDGEFIDVIALGAAHAKKIAVDKRAEYLARKAGIV